MAPSRQREREIERQRRLRQAQRRQAARRRARRRRAVVASGLAVVLLLSVIALLARGNSSSSGPGAGSTPTASASPSFPPVPAGADPRLRTKPIATLPEMVPTRLGIRDVVVGKGPAAKSGQQVTVNYVGVGYPGGKEFDSSWSRRTPFSFQLGNGDVIKGWDRGIVGMRVGGRQQLTIPSALAYGAAGQPPAITANEPLVFVVDLLAVR